MAAMVVRVMTPPRIRMRCRVLPVARAAPVVTPERSGVVATAVLAAVVPTVSMVWWPVSPAPTVAAAVTVGPVAPAGR
jgi:hypothetical protein